MCFYFDSLKRFNVRERLKEVSRFVVNVVIKCVLFDEIQLKCIKLDREKTSSNSIKQHFSSFLLFSSNSFVSNASNRLIIQRYCPVWSNCLMDLRPSSDRQNQVFLRSFPQFFSSFHPLEIQNSYHLHTNINNNVMNILESAVWYAIPPFSMQTQTRISVRSV